MIRTSDNGNLSTDLLTVGQVASWLNVHSNTVRRWVENGSLSAYRIGSRGDRRILRSELEQLLVRKPRYKETTSPQQMELVTAEVSS